MIKPNTEPFAKYKVGDKIRGRDSTGIVDGQPGIVRDVHTSYPTLLHNIRCSFQRFYKFLFFPHFGYMRKVIHKIKQLLFAK